MNRWVARGSLDCTALHHAAARSTVRTTARAGVASADGGGGAGGGAGGWEEVQLWMYDVTNGLAAQLAPTVRGRAAA